MANKYQLINEMTSETLKEITQNGESWIKFLNTASNNYKYSFNEQVLIYAQKPNATACADIETWNKKLRRWVNKGAKGIALLSIENGRNVLRHVFDISDTHSGINKEFKLWEIKPSYENGIIETLENSFGNLEVKSNLAEAIYSASINLVEDNYQDYLVDLKDVLDGSLLEGMQDIDLEGNFIVLLAKSISYMAMKRCGIEPTEHFNVSDFEMISSFNNKRVVSRLGAAISDIAEQELREIYSSVINYEKNYKLTNRTFVNNEKINYHNNEEKIMKGEMIMIELTYNQMGDYQIPQVALPKTKKMAQVRFSRMREKFLKEHKRGLYEELMLDGKMEEHLGEIEQTAQKRMKQIITSLAEKNQITEKMKRENQMSWVQAMNSIKNQAEEMIMSELIYN